VYPNPMDLSIKIDEFLPEPQLDEADRGEAVRDTTVLQQANPELRAWMGSIPGAMTACAG